MVFFDKLRMTVSGKGEIAALLETGGGWEKRACFEFASSFVPLSLQDLWSQASNKLRLYLAYSRNKGLNDCRMASP